MQHQNQSNNNQQVRLIPINSNVSYLGTTVTYGIQGANNVNASNNANFSSGNIGTNQQNTWNNQGFTNVYPTVNAGHFGQNGSGVFDANVYKKSFMVQPSIDISETSSDIVVSAFVTNGTVNNMNLNVTQDSCTISGTVWTGYDNLILNRTIPLTTSVRAEACEVTLQSGVLEIRLPKTEKITKNKVVVGQDVNQTQN